MLSDTLVWDSIGIFKLPAVMSVSALSDHNMPGISCKIRSLLAKPSSGKSSNKVVMYHLTRQGVTKAARLIYLCHDCTSVTVPTIKSSSQTECRTHPVLYLDSFVWAVASRATA